MKFTPPYSVGNVRTQLINALADEYGRREAQAMTELIFEDLKGWRPVDLVLNSEWMLSDYMIEKLESYSTRILNGEPVQYVTGKARFHGFELDVTPDVLIPRPETDELVDLIISENQESDLRVLDVGTGSGAIAIALARNLKFPEVTALDVSPAALEVARKNGRDKHAAINFICADIFKWTPPGDSFDIIVSNPPYIAESEKKDMERNVLEYEPDIALFVPDSDPLLFYRRIAGMGAEALAPGGRLYFEINPLFVSGLTDLLKELKYTDIRIVKDISGRDRFAVAKK